MDPVTLIAVPAALAVAGGVAWYGHRQKKAREATWRALAAERGGTYHPAKTSLFKQQHAAVEVQVGQALVYLDTYVVSSGKSSQTYTRARARFSLRDAPSFKVSPKGVLATVGAMIGLQDVSLGHARFDDDFVVKCEDADAVREVFSTETMERLVGGLWPARIESTGGLVTLTTTGALRDHAKLEVMLDVTGALASYGPATLARYAEHPDARFTPVSGRWDRPSPARLSVETKEGRVDVRARLATGGVILRAARKLERDDVEPFDGALPSGEGIPRGLVPEPARRHLSAVGECLLEADERRLLLTWELLPTREAFAAGVALLDACATPPRSLGAFR